MVFRREWLAAIHYEQHQEWPSADDELDTQESGEAEADELEEGCAATAEVAQA